jgi:arylsulfatase
MGQLFKDAGYATAIFGKWHLGEAPPSLPTAHGFGEFYGIPPNTSWDDAVTVSLIMVTHSLDVPEKDLIEKGTWIMQQKAGGPLERVKPFTSEVRAEIDNDLTDRSIAFIRQQKTAGKLFFLYLPLSIGRAPNYPSKQFAGKSDIGNYGDRMMEGDCHVGQVMDALKELNRENIPSPKTARSWLAQCSAVCITNTGGKGVAYSESSGHWPDGVVGHDDQGS